MMVISEQGESTVYLCNESTTEKYKDSIFKINDLKYQCNNDTRIGSKVNYLIIDIRQNKKQKISSKLISKKVKMIEIDYERCKE